MTDGGAEDSRIARALAALDAAPDVDPAKATRAEIAALHRANMEAWTILSEGRDPPSCRAAVGGPLVGLPWPLGFVEAVDVAVEGHYGGEMTPELLLAVTGQVAGVIGRYQAAGQLGDWVRVTGHAVGEMEWLLTIIDGIERPDATIALMAAAPGGGGAGDKFL